VLDSVFLFLLAFVDMFASNQINAVDFVYPLMLCSAMVSPHNNEWLSPKSSPLRS